MKVFIYMFSVSEWRQILSIDCKISIFTKDSLDCNLFLIEKKNY